MDIECQNSSLFENNSQFANIGANLSESEYLKAVLGPKHLSFSLVIPVTVVYVIIFITGVFGNVVTCIVISRNPGMQTTTNQYLGNLAISDLLLLVLGLPNELSTFWQQYPWKLGYFMCKIRAYVSETSSYVSVLTIVAFSLERYIAICHPLRRYTSGLKRPMRLIWGSWLMGLLFAVPFAYYTTVNYVEYPPDSGRLSQESALCAMLSHNMPSFPLYELSFIIFFLGPMIFIAGLYVRMGRRIQCNTLERNIEGSIHGETDTMTIETIQWQRINLFCAVAVVITFFICWAPFHAQRLLYVYRISTSGVINDWLYPVGGCLYYFSTTANPILYNVMSAKYREAFKEMLCLSPGKPSITNEDFSSTRDSTVCGSRKGSQVLRGRSVHYSHDIKYPTSMRAKNIHQRFHARRTNSALLTRNTSGINLMQEAKKPSFIVHTINGKPICQTSQKSGTHSNETHI